ncbi:MAG: hypothetical protein OXE94_02220 [Aestuariivita sp.]|nr:hypothetical protein [Aestuariivita sp.]MCY4203803.1 hypothetical protein [Aestuariivita sp.]MCY4288418.1 hypothetical protein [Aestuariivita sp.]MCY4345895.1 hypothetical protein [Aestuariivita sp.]
MSNSTNPLRQPNLEKAPLMEILAVLLSLATAATWALVTQLQQRGLAAVDARTGALVVVLSFAGLFWFLAPFVIEWHWFLT